MPSDRAGKADRDPVQEAVNAALHAAVASEPCESACTHLIVGEWTALGIANVFARRAARIEAKP